MKKRVVSMLVILCMMITIVPTMVFAANIITFSDGEVIGATTITKDTFWNIPDGTVSITGNIRVQNGATLTLNGGGTLLCKANTTNDTLFYVTEDASLVINGITLDGNRMNYFELVGIRVQDGTCTMNSGTIQNFRNIRYGAAIYVNRTYKPEEGIDELGTFYFNGGTITGNVTYDSSQKQGGAGIYNMGVVEMKGGTITGNTSAAAGGAAYNGSTGVMTIYGGTIAGNTSTKVDVNGTIMGNGIFNSSNDSTDSVLTIDGDAIVDDVYLDNTTGDKVLFITSALKHPITIDSLNINEGKVLAEGTGYTLTTSDMSMISCGVKNFYLGLDETDNQIFLTRRTDEAYYPTYILSDDDSLTVELYQNGVKVATLVYNGVAYAYIGHLKPGVYDIYVNGIDTGKDLVISGSSDNIFDSSYLELPDLGDGTHRHGYCGHADAADCPDGTNHSSHAVTGNWIPVSNLTALLGMEDGKNYYLAENITTEERIEISGTINLCLNGHSIKSTVYHEGFSNLNCAVYLKDNATFNVSDCQGTGSIKNTAGMTIATATFGENITFNLFGGAIESADKSAYFNQEAISNCVFSQYGGTVKSASTGQTATVNVLYGAGRYNLYGGTVQNASDGLAISTTSDGTQLALKGDFKVEGKIKFDHPVIIAGKISKPDSPIRVIYGPTTGTITRGWGTYMLPSVNHNEYFITTDANYMISKDADTSELKIEPYQAPTTPLDGFVTISGIQVSGNTLTAIYTGNAGDNVTYLWYRDGVYDVSGTSSNGKYYNLGPDDVGKVISVTVRGINPYSGTLSATTGIIQDVGAATYTITFDANGGTGTMATVNGVAGNYILPANEFTAPDGLQFKAWSVNGEEKAAGATIYVAENTTLTAIWADPASIFYTITFDANGGTGTMADVSMTAGDYTLPANEFTAPDGKRFKAWRVNGEEKAVGATIPVTAYTIVTAVWEDAPPTVTITFHPNGGTVTPTSATIETGSKLTELPTPTRERGYTFEGWFTVASGGTQITTDTIFNTDVVIYAQWNYTGDLGGGGGGSVGGLGGVGGGGGGGGASTSLTITLDTGDGTSVTKTVPKNSKLPKPEDPTKDGYIFDGWYTDKDFETPYDFDKPVTKPFTLYAKWIENPAGPGGTGTHYCPSKAFDDLDVTAWYHLDTDYVIENGIFKGVTEKQFAPHDKLTRAMLVTVLYRAEGEPATNRSIPFADIDMNEYYANAVVWAQQNGIVKGISETEFAPMAFITREQVATIMFRYAQYKGMNAVTLEENLHFADADEISDYAVSAMNWAVGIGMIKGTSPTTINPLGNATRVEIAAILHRFLEANK